MGLVNINYVFSAGNTIIASQHNTNNSTIFNVVNGNLDYTNLSSTAGVLYSQLNLGGNIVNADISASAAIAGSKLWSLSTIPADAGNIPLSNLGNVPISFVSGMIIMWSGSIASIPSGWVLCNGANSTPDLRGRFVIGADSSGSYQVNGTGNGSLPSTTVTVTSGASALFYDKGGSYNPVTAYIASTVYSGGAGYPHQDTISGSFGSGSTNVAVYYALAYIMKT